MVSLKVVETNSDSINNIIENNTDKHVESIYDRYSVKNHIDDKCANITVTEDYIQEQYEDEDFESGEDEQEEYDDRD